VINSNALYSSKRVIAIVTTQMSCLFNGKRFTAAALRNAISISIATQRNAQP